MFRLALFLLTATVCNFVSAADYTICHMQLDPTPPWEKRPAEDQLEPKYRHPFETTYGSPDQQLDLVLVKNGATDRPGRIYPPFARTIAYPDFMVPCLIPRNQVANIRKALGLQFLELSPELK